NLHRAGNKPAYITAIPDYIPDEGRGYGSVLRGTGHKYTFYAGFQYAVHVSYGFFVFKITDIPYTPKNIPGTYFPAAVYRESLVSEYLNPGFTGKRFFDPLHSFFGVKHRLLAGVGAYTHNQFVK